MMMMMMEDTIKRERSMENEMKLDDKLSLTTENFNEIENQHLQQQQQQHKWDINAQRRDNDNNFSNIQQNQPQQQQHQETHMPLMLHNNYSNSKNKNKNHHKHRKNSLKRATMGASAAPTSAAGTRCGEIFVANNGRKWTFICTYCNKSTRDIGAFVLHLKKMHINGIYSETASEVDDHDADALSYDEHQLDERACNTSGHEQDVRMQQAQKKKNRKKENIDNGT